MPTDGGDMGPAPCHSTPPPTPTNKTPRLQVYTAAELSVNKQVLQICAKVSSLGQYTDSLQPGRWNSSTLQVVKYPEVWIAARCNYAVHVMRVRYGGTPPAAGVTPGVTGPENSSAGQPHW